MLKTFNGPQGHLVTIPLDSKILKNNRLGDPHLRDLVVYLPHGYEDQPDRRYPVLYDIVGFTGSGKSHVGWRSFDENVPEKVDRLIHEEKMGSAIVVFPDCFNRLGGSQYTNSSAVGNYQDYLIEEVVPLVDREFRTLPVRGIFGKSSGGYGSIVNGMTRPDVWHAIACHSGDMYFDYCYVVDMPKMLNEMQKYDCSIEKFLKAFYAKPKPSEEDMIALMSIAMAAHYDPDPEAPLGFHMPMDLRTGELDPERWANWKRNDPVVMVDQYADNLKKLKLVYIECGTKDQWFLHYGARILAAKLTALGVPHEHQEFDDTHGGIDYRMDVSLPKLYEALMND